MCSSDLFAALHELASASARTLLKLASSVRALLKAYGDTLSNILLSGATPFHVHLSPPFSTFASHKEQFVQFSARNRWDFYRKLMKFKIHISRGQRPE